MPLVFVPTPLGNLRDVTLRALDVLRDCELLVAEDSRVARRLLSALQLPGKEIWTYHDHNAAGATRGILERARLGLVAVVTDAGMPGISDPGGELVAAAREGGVDVEVLPGPSAAVSVLVLSGFNARRWCFEGFPPRSAGERRRVFSAAIARGIPSVWYESPQRIIDTLADIDAVAPDARLFLLREYTKRFEQQLLGTASDVGAKLDVPVRGEIAFVIDAADEPAQTVAPDATALEARIDNMLAEQLAVSAIAKALADEGYGERRHIYARVTERKRVQRESTRS
ncbi:MAG: 16S rRNA (cytidine(1402)-2'-O)-methyltransferase [Candidatus Eremiobacteraeota bacterium]|nr:16S rRNA (cytidine(1402)-2'-O)-methyltransferase [Candidatus Eremiobacteraeota bacterium]